MALSRRVAASLLGCVVAACGLPYAPGAVRMPDARTLAHQLDADGLVGPMRRQFARLNRSGKGLTIEDFPMTGQSWQELDRNQDGVLSGAEIAPPPAFRAALQRRQREASDALFAATDTDRNGRLDKTELLATALGKQLQADFQWVERLQLPIPAADFAQALAAILADERLEAPRSFQPQGPGSGRTVFLAHGLWAPGWYYLYPLKRHLEAQGFRVQAMNFIPTLPRIEDYALQLQGEIERRQRLGQFDRFDLIGHSMGGLVSRYYLRSLGGERKVDHFVSFATPHQGSQLAWLGPLTITRQLRPNSDFLKALDAPGLSPGIGHAAIWTTTDGMVIPGSNAQYRLPGARNYPAVPHSNHYLICFQSTAFKYVDETLAR